MHFFNKNSKNMIEKRVIYLKDFPSDEEIDRLCADKNFNIRRKWSVIKSLEYDRSGNQLIISREQAERSGVINITEFIDNMHLLLNIEKIVYTVNNKKLNVEVTVWDEPIYPKKQGYPAMNKAAVLIVDKTTGKKSYSCTGDDDGTYTTVNGTAFPSCCVVSNGLVVLTQLEADGTLPDFEAYKFVEMDIDFDKITEKRMEKPDIVYSNEIKIEAKDNSTFYIPIIDLCFDDEAKRRVGQNLLFSSPSKMETINLKNKNAPVLTVTKGQKLCSIAIFDEANGLIYYYNNGDTSGEYTELDGETYPNFMITDNKEVILSIFKDFIETGKPSEKVQWLTEEE